MPACPRILAEEALDFVRFVKARHADATRAFAHVEEARVHRRSHPGEVMTVTIEEWEELIGGEG